MSTLVTQDYAFRLMREHDCRFWKLKDSDGKSVLGEQKSDEVGIEESVRKLEDTLAELNGRFVNLEARSRSSKDRGAGGDLKSGIFDLRVKLDGNGIGSTATASPSINPALYDRIAGLEKQLLEVEYKHKMSDLQRQIDELKEGNPMLDQLVPVLSGLFAQGNPGGTAAAQAPALAGPEKKQGRVKELLVRLSKVDPNVLETLECLVKFAEANPSQYLGYVNMLKSQV